MSPREVTEGTTEQQAGEHGHTGGPSAEREERWVSVQTAEVEGDGDVTAG